MKRPCRDHEIPADNGTAGSGGFGMGSAATARSGDQRIDALLSGVRWAGSSLTYSDPNSPSDYQPGYRVDHDGDGVNVLADGFRPLDAKQRIAMHFALDRTDFGQGAAAGGFSVEGFTNLNVHYAGAGSGAGAIRLANMKDYDGAYAFYPSESHYGGDAFFGPDAANSAPGAWSWHVFLHELGHALGLKHGHEKDGFGALPASYDSNEFSVMTYASYIGGPTGGATFERAGGPQTYMMLDIAALQNLYGANFDVNSGATTYRWNPSTGVTLVDGEPAITPLGNRVFMTIWDGGGVDAYDLSLYDTNIDINLAPGGHSTFSTAQRAHLGGGPNGGHARGNVFNAFLHDGDPRSLIENATGGSGADTIRGNAAANLLAGGAGDDRLLGLASADDLRGGAGKDILSGGAGNDRLAGGGGRDILFGGRGNDVFRLESLADSRPGRADILRAGDGGAAFDGAGAAFGDRLDLQGIDANATAPGDQAFLFGTARGPARLWLENVGSDTHVLGNVNARARAEFELVIEDGEIAASAYRPGDFLL